MGRRRLMILGPIALRELLVVARNPLTYRGRWITALVVLIMGGGLAALFSLGGGGRAGGQVLGSLSFYILIYCMAGGAQSTADSLSREKREGTMGLLFLTLLKPREIISGKFIAGGLSTFYGLLAAVPVLSLIFLQGGVEWIDVVQLFAASVNAMFVAASIGMFISSHTTERKHAVGGATWIVLLLWFGVPALATLLERTAGWEWLGRKVIWFSISHCFQVSYGAPMTFLRHNPWHSMLGTHAIGWLLLSLATYYLPRKWQDAPMASGKGMPLGQRLKQWTYGSPEVRIARRKRLLEKNPFFWLTCRERTKPIGPLILLFVITSAFVIPTYWIGWNGGLIIPYVVICAGVTKVYLAGAASQKMTEEIEAGTLELLFSTPLSVPDLIIGQFRAMWLQFGKVLTFQMIVQVIAIFIAWDQTPASRPGGLLMTLIGIGGFLIFFIVDFFIISLVGLWAPLVVKQPKQSLPGVLMRAVFLPAALFLACTALYNLILFLLEIPAPPPSDYAIPLLYYSLSAAVALFWFFYIRRKLPVKLRELAFKRYSAEQKTSFLGSLFRRKIAPPVLAK